MSACEVYREQSDDKLMHLSLEEHFDYRSIHVFRQLCVKDTDEEITVLIDMSQTRYVDSSGIALLMCLNHWLRAPKLTIRVINCCPEIKHILSISRLSKNISVD